MNIRLRFLPAMLLAAGACGYLPAKGTALPVVLPKQTTLSAPSAKPVTVADIIQLTRIGSGELNRNGSWKSPIQRNDEIVWSPDGKQVAVVTNRGNLENDTIDYSLMLFQSAEVFSAPRGRTLATLTSSSTRPGIQNVRWIGPEMLAFVGERAGEQQQVYTVNSRTGTLVRRTQSTAPIWSFDTAAEGRIVVYATEADSGRIGTETIKTNGFVLPETANLPDLILRNYDRLLSHAEPFLGGHPLELWIVRDGAAAVPLAHPCAHLSSLDPVTLPDFAISPTGEELLVSCAPKETPPHWSEYRVLREKPNANFNLYDSYRKSHQWILLDLKSGLARPLIDAPIPPEGTVLGANGRHASGGRTYDGRVFWAPDGKSVIVANAWLPLGAASSGARRVRASTLYTVQVDLQTGALAEVGTVAVGLNVPPAHVEYWDPVANIIKREGGGGTRYFRKAAGRWRQVSSGSWPELALEQGMNVPPHIVATDPRTHRKHVMYDPNPSLFHDYRFGAVSILRSWDVIDGVKSYATLYWPPDYVPGRRYPLVIQGHGSSIEEFWPMGNIPSRRHAAQPLVNAGFFVVQYNEGGDTRWDQADFSTYKDTAFAELEDMIDQLDGAGLIDRSRIALSGYSTDHGLFLHFMTHSSYPIAAAALGEGVEFSYLAYLTALMGHPLQKDWERLNGGLPWGEGRASWLARAPGFNLDRINAAIQFEAAVGEETEAFNVGTVLCMWENYQGLRLLGRPVEMLVLPQGQHGFVNKPRTRYASQQGAVDWFRYWLQDYVRKDPCAECGETMADLNEKYARWQELRERRKRHLQ